MEFDDAGLAFIETGEFLQAVIKGDKVAGAFGGEEGGIVEVDGEGTGASFDGVFAAGVFDEDLPHVVGRDGDEMGAAFVLGLILLGHAEPSLVDEGGGLEGMAGSFVAHVGTGEAA